MQFITTGTKQEIVLGVAEFAIKLTNETLGVEKQVFHLMRL
jgi:hypothetical protein